MTSVLWSLISISWRIWAPDLPLYLGLASLGSAGIVRVCTAELPGELVGVAVLIVDVLSLRCVWRIGPPDRFGPHWKESLTVTLSGEPFNADPGGSHFI